MSSDFKLDEFKLIQLKFEMQQVCVKSAVWIRFKKAFA